MHRAMPLMQDAVAVQTRVFPPPVGRTRSRQILVFAVRASKMVEPTAVCQFVRRSDKRCGARIVESVITLSVYTGTVGRDGRSSRRSYGARRSSGFFLFREGLKESSRENLGGYREETGFLRNIACACP